MQNNPFRRRYIPTRPKNYRPDFKRYARDKARWLAEHPAATPEKYEEAMQEIARACGI